MLVEVNDQGLGLGTDLTGGGSGGVAGLQGMTAAQTPTALPALAAVNVDAATQRLGRQFHLILGVLVRFDDRAVAVRAGGGQRGVEMLVDLVIGQRRSMAVRSVLIAGLAARSSGVGLGSLLGEGGGLAFGLTLGGFEGAGQFIDASPEPFHFLALGFHQGQEFVVRGCHPALAVYAGIVSCTELCWFSAGTARVGAKQALRSFQGGIEWCRLRGSVTFHYVVLKPVKVLHPAYFGYLFKSSVFIQALRATTDFIRDGQDLRYSHFVLVPLPVVPLEEQVAIAAYLDRETAKLDSLIRATQTTIETLREYRTALISAAVTGQIDVSTEVAATSESEAVVVERQVAKPNPYFRRTVFAAEIIDRLCDDSTFGHVKFQKCLFVAQHHLRIGDFEENYKRMAAGPYDNRLIRSVDSQLEKSHWFKADKVAERYTYRRLEKAGAHRQYFDRYFGDHAEQLASLLDLFKPLDTDRAEIVATLYAVWNDFILRNEPFDDDRIVKEVLANWHDRKKRFDESRWRRALGWMKEKNLVPSGFGKPTVLGDGSGA